MTDATAEEAVLAANAAFYAAFNERDMDAMSALWAQSVPVACTHPGWNAIVGRGEVLDSWRMILENPRQPRVFSGAAQAFVLGDVALVICRELVAGNPLAATNVFVREAGRWRLVHHHSSPVAMQRNV